MHMIQKESMTLMVSSSERFGKQIVQIIQIISQNEALAYLVFSHVEPYSPQHPQIHSKNHASNTVKTSGVVKLAPTRGK